MVIKYSRDSLRFLSKLNKEIRYANQSSDPRIDSDTA